MWLVLAPLLVGYGEVAPILHDVSMGLLVCVATLAALERPSLRYALVAPGLWLVASGRVLSWGAEPARAELLAGVLLVLLALVPSARPVGAPSTA